MPYWHFMDWAGVGRDGEAGALNAQLAGAFARRAPNWPRAVGWEREAERLAARGRAIGAGAEGAALGRAARRLRRHGRSGDRRAASLRVSQHANAAIALWADAPAERIGARAGPHHRQPAA